MSKGDACAVQDAGRPASVGVANARSTCASPSPALMCSRGRPDGYRGKSEAEDRSRDRVQCGFDECSLSVRCVRPPGRHGAARPVEPERDRQPADERRSTRCRLDVPVDDPSRSHQDDRQIDTRRRRTGQVRQVRRFDRRVLVDRRLDVRASRERDPHHVLESIPAAALVASLHPAPQRGLCAPGPSGGRRCPSVPAQLVVEAERSTATSR